MKIKIFCFGKLDKKFFLEAFNDYAKRISKFAALEIIELKEEFVGENNKNSEINSNHLFDKLEKIRDFEIVVLDVKSKQVSSEQFAEIIDNNKNYKSGKMAFIVGPSDGYSQKFLSKYSQKISLGSVTLPHQLFRVILAEQIYRGLKIINNEKYHK
ncbi:23S rRNA (pseudouridine(1915)-N(3))-methyltransferase RlmH [Mesoplasma syrphidae]|uniref:Ribosomal RNA large subunit methyltransferase H n=1 Tax=Mesoplasma syrphidae TaxID=225999 RepID=A0A2K9BK94_9MOLU|nr:23S rRNA (pseudouridine(1915)-N(3))-methyltransferase RlmH [Mesoplasma syrphidae]AUF83656.1 23S rRNA (pseudouridine(1915)-N(3))-methyltransferase RlmH [Mesoplasma syrphidae]